MCGILGSVSVEGRPFDAKWLERASAILIHRGPDDGATWSSTDGVVALGCRRLRILDLSEAARMPMRDGENWITYNGEIYNYLELRTELEEKGYGFHTTSDTEVLLKAYREWGSDCLRRLNGMFAFAIWDGARKEMFAARDRFGVKPFYYFFDGATFLFASEIKALLLHPLVPRRPNRSLIYDYLVLGMSDHTEETFFEQIRQLPPSGFLVLDGGSLVQRRWWSVDLNPDVDACPGTERQLVEEFQELFDDAVRLRLRSDVPIGTCLSGGLDSSSIVTVANRLMFDELALDRRIVGEHQKTFSACFADERFDERRFISQVIQATGAENHMVFPDGETMWNELRDVVWYMDEPFSSTSQYSQWNVMRLVAESGVTVTLDGQGGDELLAGYPGYYAVWMTTLIRRGRLRDALREARASMRFGGRGRSAGDLMLRTIYGVLPFGVKATLRTLAAERLNGTREGHSLEVLRPTLRNEFDERRREWLSYQDGNLRNLSQRLHDDVFRFSLPALLRYEDRNSMAFSVEARTPFLDYRLAQFLLRMPASMKMRSGWTKWVLRQAMEGTLPRSVQWRSDKKGFVTPEVIWLRQGEGRIRELFSGSVLSAEFIDPARIRQGLGRYLSGKPEVTYHTEIWRWINLELWMQRFLKGALVES